MENAKKDFEILCNVVKKGNVPVEMYEFLVQQRNDLEEKNNKIQQDYDTRTMLVEALEAIIISDGNAQMQQKMTEAIKKYC